VGRGLKADLTRDLKAGLLEKENSIHKRSTENVGKSDSYTKQNWLNKQIILTLITSLTNFDVLLNVHLSIIFVINQLNAHNLVL